MAAHPDRIQFVQSNFRRAIAEDAAVRSRHGALARESADPTESYFSDVGDAEVVAAERLALLSPERRRFSVRTVGLDAALAIDPTDGRIPNTRYIDTERRCDRKAVIATVSIDLNTQQAEYGIWG